MNSVFGGPLQIIDDTKQPADARPSPAEYAAWVKDRLANLQLGESGVLRFRRPRPTAAFSPQDTTHPDYEMVKMQARANGFEPIERGTGGRLTMFDENALAITLLSPHPDPHSSTMQRYDVFARAIADVLRILGIDAHIGELPNEYCPGKYSINAGGKVKLVGIAQRMNRRCIQMGAIISVQPSERACAAIADAYQAMALPFDPSTYGAMAALLPQVSYDAVCTAFTDGLGKAFELGKAT